MSPSKKLIDAIVVCAELTQTQLSRPAATVFAQDLARYPEDQVLKALERCRRELKSRLTLADVLTRIDDGRPGVEEAWALMPRSEAQTVVWTEEMACAFGVALRLLDTDPIGARMAFKEAYTAGVQKARDKGIPPKWTPSLGHDVGSRGPVILEAVKQGRLKQEHAVALLPNLDQPGSVLKELGYDAKVKKVAAG